MAPGNPLHCHRTECLGVCNCLYPPQTETSEDMDRVYLVHNYILSLRSLRTMPGIEQVLRKYFMNGEKKNYLRKC